MQKLDDPVPNSALSARTATGPRTPAGKATSSRNALTHGLTAKEIVLFDEEPADFEALRVGFVARFGPADAVEAFLVDRIAACAWRLRRALRIEREILTAYNSLHHFSPYKKVDAGAVFALDVEAGSKLARVERHEAAIERQMFRALHELQRLQAAREGADVPLPISVDVDVAVGTLCGDHRSE